MNATKIKLSQNILGDLMINAEKASSKIQMAFRTTTDNLSAWKKDDRERFQSIMNDIGLSKEAKAIIASHERSLA